MTDTFIHFRNGSIGALARPGRAPSGKKYSPDQPRDEHGRFGSGGSSTAATTEQIREAATTWSSATPPFERGVPKVLGVDLPHFHAEDAASADDRDVRLTTSMLRAVRDAAPTTKTLYRGMSFPAQPYDKDMRAFVSSAKVGGEMDIPLAGFSTSPSTARGFAAGDVMVQLQSGAKAFDEEPFSQHGESEWVSGGRFQVVDVRDNDQNEANHYLGNPYHGDGSNVTDAVDNFNDTNQNGIKGPITITLKQLDTFDPDAERKSLKPSDFRNNNFWHLFLGAASAQASGAKYSPDQPRDEHGRFGSGGSVSSAVVHVPGFGDLSPALQAKMRTKIEAMTGLPFDQVTAQMRDNLTRLGDAEWKVNPGSADWYQQYHDAAITKVAELNKGQAAGVPPMTEPKYEAMMSVTSALNDPKDNLTIVNGWSKLLLSDPTLHVSQQQLDDYNHFAQGRDRQGVFQTNTDLEPGDYKLSELPSYMVPSMVRGLDDQPPYTLNTESLVKVVDLYRGENPDDVIGGPKQRSFYNNLTDPQDEQSVTVDKWMYRAAVGDIPLTKETKAYGAITQPLAAWETDTRFGGRVQLSDGSITRSGASPQDFFQSGPASKPDGWPGNFGLYPVVAQAVMDATKTFNEGHGTSLSPSAFQALTWAGVQR